MSKSTVIGQQPQALCLKGGIGVIGFFFLLGYNNMFETKAMELSEKGACIFDIPESTQGEDAVELNPIAFYPNYTNYHPQPYPQASSLPDPSAQPDDALELKIKVLDNSEEESQGHDDRHKKHQQNPYKNVMTSPQHKRTRKHKLEDRKGSVGGVSEDQWGTESVGKLVGGQKQNIFSTPSSYPKDHQNSSISSKSSQQQLPTPKPKSPSPKPRYSQQKLSKFGGQKASQRISEELRDRKQELSQEEKIGDTTTRSPSTKKPSPILKSAPLQKHLLTPIKQNYIFECLLVVQKGYLGFCSRYFLKDKNTGTVIATAKKQIVNFTAKYVIAKGMSNCSRRDLGFLGAMEAGFGGRDWNLMCPIVPSKFNQQQVCEHYRRVLALNYKTSVLGAHSIKKMDVITADPKASSDPKKGLLKLSTPTPTLQKNKPIYNFNNLARMPSDKNFLLETTGTKGGDKTCLIFAKQKENIYQINVQYPFTLLQGFALGLASLDNKLFV